MYRKLFIYIYIFILTGIIMALYSSFLVVMKVSRDNILIWIFVKTHDLSEI